MSAIEIAELYYIPSSQNSTRRYAVALTSHGWRCECKAGQHNRRCWHVEAAVAGMARPARLKRRVVA